MRVELLTAAKSTALLTYAQVVARPGFSAASTTVLDALIAAVSAAAVRVILGNGTGGGERAIVAQQYRVTQPGSGRDQLLLPRRPIDSASVSVELDGTALVVTDDYSIRSAAEGILYRSTLWPVKNAYPTMAGENSVETTFWAGYVPPAVAAAWTNRTVAVGEWVLPSNLAVSPLRFRCTSAGAMGATEPTWSSYDAGDTVAAGAATLVAHELPDAPSDLLEGAMFAVQAWYRLQDSPVFRGISVDRFGPHSIEYASQADLFAEALPGPTLCLWEGLRS